MNFSTKTIFVASTIMTQARFCVNIPVNVRIEGLLGIFPSTPQGGSVSAKKMHFYTPIIGVF